MRGFQNQVDLFFAFTSVFDLFTRLSQQKSRPNRSAFLLSMRWLDSNTVALATWVRTKNNRFRPVVFYPSHRLGMESRFSVYGIAEGVWHHSRCIFCGLIPYCLAPDSIPQQVVDSIHGSAVIKTRQSELEPRKAKCLFYLQCCIF